MVVKPNLFALKGVLVKMLGFHALDCCVDVMGDMSCLTQFSSLMQLYNRGVSSTNGVVWLNFDNYKYFFKFAQFYNCDRFWKSA